MLRLVVCKDGIFQIKTVRRSYGKTIVYRGETKCGQRIRKDSQGRRKRGNGYLESEDTIVTWCVGHLVTMSYPEVYDEALKKWDMNTLPFLPETFLYEVIPSVKWISLIL